jgi:hypothetical protein
VGLGMLVATGKNQEASKNESKNAHFIGNWLINVNIFLVTSPPGRGWGVKGVRLSGKLFVLFTSHQNNNP